VTGYFGALTQKAVMRFLKKHEIDPIGAVGPNPELYVGSLNTSPRVTM